MSTVRSFVFDKYRAEHSIYKIASFVLKRTKGGQFLGFEGRTAAAMAISSLVSIISPAGLCTTFLCHFVNGGQEFIAVIQQRRLASEYIRNGAISKQEHKMNPGTFFYVYGLLLCV